MQSNDGSAIMGRNTEAGLFRQIGILFHRDAELFMNDRKRVGITLLLPLVIGLVIVFVADSDMGKIYEPTRATIFTMICAGIYVGMFNSLPLVCKERHIIKREYMTGMKISSYIMAMVLFQAIISLIQSLMFISIYWISKMNLPEGELISGSSFIDYTISLFLIMFAADMMGLLISSIVRSNELANLIAPIIIIFQLVMCGVLFTLKGMAEKIAYLTVSKWGMQAMGALAKLENMKTSAKDTLGEDFFKDEFIDTLKLPEGTSAKDVKKMASAGGDDYAGTAANLGEAWLWLLVFIVVLTILCVVFLRRVEKDKR